MSEKTIPHHLIKRAEQFPDKIAMQYKENGEWKPITWSEYASFVKAAAKALISLGLQKGDKTCLLGFNRPEWVIFDVASIMAGGIPAGIYETCSSEEVSYIISHSESPVVLVENEEQLNKVLDTKEQLPNLEHIVLMRGTTSENSMVLSWEEFLEKGSGPDDSTVQGRLDSLVENDPATFIYTSGTTGPPKAVMLSHTNLVWTSITSLDMLKIGDTDTNLSYLPLSHIAEQMFTVHGPIVGGIKTSFAENRDSVADNLKELQPTIIFGVPRVWEKFHTGVSAKLAVAKGIKGMLVKWARKQATQYHDIVNAGKTPDAKTERRYHRAQKLVFGKLRAALGLSNAKYCVSGAAPIASEILEFFSSLDVPILEVYGQSEGSGPTSFNIPGKTRYGSVGPPLPGVEVKIAEDGEIIVKGNNVFLGYYKDEETTRETLIDGWLHSGDLGKFDEDGFLWVTGRKKDIIVTSGGKNITPANIEGALKKLELVSQAVIVGDNRKFISALITLDETTAGAFAESEGLSGENLHENDTVTSEIQKGVDEVNSKLMRVANVRKFTILPRDFTIEDGELTPTMKIKRNIVYKQWTDTIDAMYTPD